MMEGTGGHSELYRPRLHQLCKSDTYLPEDAQGLIDIAYDYLLPFEKMS